MKTIVFFAAIFLTLSFSATCVSAQSVGINNDGSEPNANAMLDIKAANKGLLIPRMDSNSRKAIPGTQGLLVYDSTTNSFWYNDGMKWNNLFSNSSGWSLSGNSNTDTSENFIGTTDGQPLLIKVNNSLSGEIINKYPFNTGWGFQSLTANTTGAYNTANGYNALLANTTGYGNTAHGSFALYQNTSGYSNTAIGYVALFSNTTGINNTATGALSIENNTGGYNNTAAGTASMQYNTNGAYNSSFGASSLNANTTGNSNTAIGEKSMINNTTGSYNSTLGSGALFSNIAGAYNVALGFQSLYLNTANTNVAVGYKSMYNYVTGSSNTAIGFNALYGQDIFDPAGTPNSGNNNTVVGYQALYGYGIINNNTAVGYQAFYNGQTDNGTAIGYRANCGGPNAVSIGANANGNASNSIAIGANALASYNNTVQLGDGNISDVYTNTNCTFHGKVFLQYSDARLKYAVQPLTLGLQFIQLLKPVTYFFKNDPGDHLYSGFIAQDVERTAQQLGANFSGVYKPINDKDYYALNYQDFIMPLVKSVQELSAENDSLKKKMDNTEVANKNLQVELKNLMEEVNVLNQKLEKITERPANNLNGKSTDKSN